jgi:hypothetical protein
MGQVSYLLAGGKPRQPLFPLGNICATPGALEVIRDASAEPHELAAELITRHVLGDWGQLDAEDIAANNASVKDGTRILSAYELSTGTKLWVITEADRSTTTLLLPEEY